MKKLLPLIALLFFVLVWDSVYSQSKMTEEQKQELKARYDAYKEKLNLSDEQSVKIEGINKTYFEQLAELKNSNESKMSKYRKYKNIKLTRDKQMKEVLDKDQYQTYQAFQEEMKDELKENRRNR